jgi:murein DD-endopeptidase MepM/ murein hydrolase activator NlpD
MKLYLIAITSLVLTAFASTAHAESLFTLHNKIQEGAIVRGTTDPGNAVSVNGDSIPVSAEGFFVFGIHRDYDKRITVKVTNPNGTSDTMNAEVAQREYKIERIDGLPPQMVTPRSPETLARIKKEWALKSAARPYETDATWYREPFAWPAKGRISGFYGSQRILNGEPKNPHYGVDVAAPKGTEIKAPASGTVTLAEPDMYFEGGLIFIDHGHGLISVLMHLDSIGVKPGQFVRQGDVVGTMGATGRATGVHLD